MNETLVSLLLDGCEIRLYPSGRNTINIYVMSNNNTVAWFDFELDNAQSINDALERAHNQLEADSNDK